MNLTLEAHKKACALHEEMANLHQAVIDMYKEEEKAYRYREPRLMNVTSALVSAHEAARSASCRGKETHSQAAEAIERGDTYASFFSSRAVDASSSYEVLMNKAYDASWDAAEIWGTTCIMGAMETVPVILSRHDDLVSALAHGYQGSRATQLS